MSIATLPTTAMLTQTVPTPKDHSTARVIRDTLGMESRVLVKYFVLPRCYQRERVHIIHFKVNSKSAINDLS